MRRWNTTIVLIAALAMTTVVADNVTTAICLNFLGEAVHELNPLSNFLIGFWGTNLTMVANAFWSGVIIIWLVQWAMEHRAKTAVALLVFLVLIRGGAAINNFSILKGDL